jgi:molecular chaperone GrpE
VTEEKKISSAPEGEAETEQPNDSLSPHCPQAQVARKGKEEQERADSEAEILKPETETETEEVETPATPEEPVDERTALRQQLKEAEAQAQEYLDDLRRERAAFQNYRKRQEQEQVEQRKMAQANLLMQLFPILDDIERALESIPEEQADEPWVKGFALIQRKLQTTVEGTGATLIKVEPGQPFDPFFHEAVSYEDHEDFKEGEIIGVWQKGYKLGKRVLCPAMVRVAK